MYCSPLKPSWHLQGTASAVSSSPFSQGADIFHKTMMNKDIWNRRLWLIEGYFSRESKQSINRIRLAGTY